MPTFQPKMNASHLVLRALRDTRAALRSQEGRTIKARTLKRILGEVYDYAKSYQIAWEEIVPDGVVAHPGLSPDMAMFKPLPPPPQNPSFMNPEEFKVTKLTVAMANPSGSTWVEQGRIVSVGPRTEAPVVEKVTISAPQAPTNGATTKEVIQQEQSAVWPAESDATVLGLCLNPRLLLAKLPDGRHISLLKPVGRVPNKHQVVRVKKAQGAPNLYEVRF